MRIGACFFSSTLLECARFEANERVDCLRAVLVLDLLVATMVNARVKEEIELFPYLATLNALVPESRRARVLSSISCSGWIKNPLSTLAVREFLDITQIVAHIQFIHSWANLPHSAKWRTRVIELSWFLCALCAPVEERVAQTVLEGHPFALPLGVPSILSLMFTPHFANCLSQPRRG